MHLNNYADLMLKKHVLLFIVKKKTAFVWNIIILWNAKRV